MKFLLVAILAIASVNAKAVLNAGDTSRPAPWYSCEGKQPGNYINPRDCTRFIACDAGLQAIEFDCGECSNRPDACTPQNRLVYNSTVDACLWADETECAGDNEPEPTTEENSQPTTTTEAATPKPPPTEGGPCDPEDCENTGYCQSYLRCDKESKVWVREECGDELFWNKKSGAIHGGNCDLIDNLDPADLEELRKDPECLACFWRADGECSASYKYQAPDLRNRNVLDLSCPAGLIFSEQKETCQHCQDVQRENGQNCCGTV